MIVDIILWRLVFKDDPGLRGPSESPAAGAPQVRELRLHSFQQLSTCCLTSQMARDDFLIVRLVGLFLLLSLCLLYVGK